LEEKWQAKKKIKRLHLYTGSGILPPILWPRRYWKKFRREILPSAPRLRMVSITILTFLIHALSFLA
jgi:hypothetical protein